MTLALALTLAVVDGLGAVVEFFITGILRAIEAIAGSVRQHNAER